MYKIYNSSANPILILNLIVEHDNYDINASPDKREVFIKNEKEVLIRDGLIFKIIDIDSSNPDFVLINVKMKCF